MRGFRVGELHNDRRRRLECHAARDPCLECGELAIEMIVSFLDSVHIFGVDLRAMRELFSECGVLFQQAVGRLGIVAHACTPLRAARAGRAYFAAA